MFGSNKKSARGESSTEANRRAVFGDATFWNGPAGWVLVLMITLLGAAAILFVYYTGDLSSKQSASIVESTNIIPINTGGASLTGTRSSVDGSLLTANSTVPTYFAVMIDNHPQARPEAGLSVAPLVIEAPVEGGITRFMAIFANGADLRRIGPVRSVRLYYAEWAEEYGAVTVHVGGSPQALDFLATSANSRDMDQVTQGGYFWRDREREAPHNVYTSSELLHSALTSVGENKNSLNTDRPFKADGLSGSRSVEQQAATKVSISYSDPSFAVDWVYNDKMNTYARNQGSAMIKGGDGSVVVAKNIIVQITDVRTIDSEGRKKIRTTGIGDALVIRDGVVIKARWSKQTGGRTRFLFADKDTEIPLNVGPTWIEVVDGKTPINY